MRDVMDEYVDVVHAASITKEEMPLVGYTTERKTERLAAHKRWYATFTWTPARKRCLHSGRFRRFAQRLKVISINRTFDPDLPETMGWWLGVTYTTMRKFRRLSSLTKADLLFGRPIPLFTLLMTLHGTPGAMWEALHARASRVQACGNPMFARHASFLVTGGRGAVLAEEESARRRLEIACLQQTLTTDMRPLVWCDKDTREFGCPLPAICLLQHWRLFDTVHCSECRRYAAACAECNQLFMAFEEEYAVADGMPELFPCHTCRREFCVECLTVVRRGDERVSLCMGCTTEAQTLCIECGKLYVPPHWHTPCQQCKTVCYGNCPECASPSDLPDVYSCGECKCVLCFECSNDVRREETAKCGMQSDENDRVLCDTCAPKLKKACCSCGHDFYARRGIHACRACGREACFMCWHDTFDMCVSCVTAGADLNPRPTKRSRRSKAGVEL